VLGASLRQPVIYVYNRRFPFSENPGLGTKLENNIFVILAPGTHPETSFMVKEPGKEPRKNCWLFHENHRFFRVLKYPELADSFILIFLIPRTTRFFGSHFLKYSELTVI
jgi:hypothetical protein